MPDRREMLQTGNSPFDEFPADAQIKREGGDEPSAASGDRTPPPAVVGRLPRYHRCLRELVGMDILRISSSELAVYMGSTASQVRQDLSYFGGFGQQGYGYGVKHLYTKISSIIGVNDNYGAVIIGAGNLGRALAADSVFSKRGVMLRGIFDYDEKLIGGEAAGLTVRDMNGFEAFVSQNSVDIAVICVADRVKELAARIAACKIKGILNFSNTEISFRSTRGARGDGNSHTDGTSVRNVYLGDSLMTLCYDIKQRESGGNI